MKFKNKPILYIIISSFVFFAGFLSVLIWYVNYLSQNEAVTSRIIKAQIQRLLDLDSEVEKPRAYIDWDLKYKIKANKLVFKEHDGNTLVSVDDISLDVFIPMLFLRKIDITRMGGKNLYVNFERWENKKINIIEIFNITGFFKIYFNNSTITVNNYLFDFVDRVYSPNKFLSLRGNDILVTKFSLKKYLQLIMDGDIVYLDNIIPFFISSDMKIKNNQISYNLSTELSNIRFKDFFDYGKEIYPDLTLLDGRGNIKAKVSSGKYFNIDADIYAIHFGTKKFPNFFDYSKPFNFNSKFSYENKKFLFDEANAISADFDVFMSGMVYDFFNIKNRIVSIFVEVKNNSNAKELMKILPNGLPVLRGAIDRAKKYEIDGSVNGSMQVNFPYMTGEVVVNNTKAFLEEGILTGDVYLVFDKDNIDITSRLFSPSRNNYFDVSGKVKFVAPIVLDLNITSSKNTDLILAHSALNVASDIVNFPTGPVPLLQIKKGVIDDFYIKITGTPPYVYLNGKLKTSGVKLSYPGFYGDAQNASAEIEFAGDTINYNNVKAYYENYPTSAYGETKIHEEGLTHVFLNIEKIPLDVSQMFIDNSPLMSEVSKGLEFLSDVDGFGSLALTMKAEKGMNLPYISGSFTLLGNDGNIKDLSHRVENVTGIVDFDNDLVTLDLSGFVNNIATGVKGKVRRNFSELEIINNQADIKKAYEIIHNSPMFGKIKDGFNDFSHFSGSINSNIKVSGNFLTQEIQTNTTVDILEGCLKYLDIDEYIYVNGGKVIANDTQMFMDNIKGSVFGKNFTLNGDISNFSTPNEKSDIVFDIENVDIKNVSKIIDTKLLTPEVSDILSKFNYLGGNIDIYAQIVNKSPETTISFLNTKLFHIPTNDTIVINSGKMFVSETTVGFDSLDTDIKNSSYVATGNIKNYNAQTPVFDLNVSANVDGNDFNSSFSNVKNFPLSLKGRLYLNADFVGSFKDWNLKMRAMFEEGANVFYKGANLGNELSKFTFANLHFNNDNLFINDLKLYTSSELFSAPDGQDVLDIKGKILNVSSDKPSFENLIVNVNDFINISLINILIKESKNENPFISEGFIKGNVSLHGQFPDVKLLGEAYVQKAFIPSINTKISDMYLMFKPDVIEIPDSSVTIVNSQANIQGSILNKLTSPLMVKDLKISSKNLNYDEIVENFSTIFKSTSNDVNMNNIPKPPLVIEKGELSSDEFIYQGLLCKDVTANFSVSNDWLCKIEDLKADVTTGKVYGDISYNFYTTETSGTIEMDGVMSNAIASTFLNLPNEIYGDLSGVISFTTKGLENEEILENLDGTASFNLNDGRMLRMGSVEYMLKIANILKGGIPSLNLNAIVNIVAPKTGFFDSIVGEIVIKEGVISTDKISFSSKELELFLTGIYDMNNSNINATIIGQIPKEAKDSIIGLGFVGEISLSSLKRRITRQFKKNDIVAINPVSYLNSITSLHDDVNKYRFFLVTLEGDLYKDKYVKSFKWVKTK